jgi:large subunit ribosomal protein L20
MARVKRGVMTRKRHQKVLKAARGYWGNRSKWFKMANEAVMHAGQYAYRDRRVRKREFRSLWIQRINAAARSHGLTYSRLMHGIKKAGIGLDRKALAEIAYHDPAGFTAVVDKANAALA